MPDLTPAQAAAAEQERLDNEREELIYAIEGPFGRDDYDEIRAALVAPLAAIRRHAAATALREQADRLGKKRAANLSLATGQFAGTEFEATYRAFAVQASTDAGMLRRAADDVIAEGWEHTCAVEYPATRENPGYGCEVAVENEGDTCLYHTDDRDPDA